MDESLFVHQGNKQIWVAGLINNTSRKIRLEILPNRNAETIKKIITNLVPTSNKIVTDGAIIYNLLSNPQWGYEHSVHIHGHGDFGERVDSTSHIEQLWHNLKHIITSIYYIIPSEKFVLFLLEAEFRRNTKKFSLNSLIKEFESICAYINNIAGCNFYDLNLLNKLTIDSF